MDTASTVKQTPMRSGLKSFNVVEVQNGFLVIPGSLYARFDGMAQEMFVAHDIEEVGKVIKALYAGKEVK